MKAEKKVYATVTGYAFVLALVLSGFIALAWVGGVQRDRERVRSRYAFCVEIEKLKTHDRTRAQSDLAESERFLRKNPQGTKDFSRELLLRVIARTKQQITDDKPNDCVNFSHNP